MAEVTGPYTLRAGKNWWYWFYTGDWSGVGSGPDYAAWQDKFLHQPNDLHFTVRPDLSHTPQGYSHPIEQSNVWGLHVVRAEVVLESKYTSFQSFRYSHRVLVENASPQEMKFYIVVHDLT